MPHLPQPLRQTALLLPLIATLTLLSTPEAVAQPTSNSRCQTVAAMPAPGELSPLVERLDAGHPTRESMQTLETWRTGALAACEATGELQDNTDFNAMRHRADFLREASAALPRQEDYHRRRHELLDQALATGELTEATLAGLRNELNSCFDPTFANLPAGEGGAAQFHAWNTPIERCFSTFDITLRDHLNARPSSGALFWLLLTATLALSTAGVGIAYAKHRKNERQAQL
ncbi:hypothetical protein DV096_18380 [Bradymonadaceae bacterium TMQ3]|nr:hypothetical protein DV096_18350 [Bradymonadaceae bacterium TMQ3]RDV36712.1 hypothetical protein DV096_18380 [Bradymonadaceae bacterium TMQ3]TXC68515.1 hypothetical protein FRC91_18220 [Bradymonadales bacterium TMQ1]